MLFGEGKCTVMLTPISMQPSVLLWTVLAITWTRGLKHVSTEPNFVVEKRGLFSSVSHLDSVCNKLLFILRIFKYYRLILFAPCRSCTVMFFSHLAVNRAISGVLHVLVINSYWHVPVLGFSKFLNKVDQLVFPLFERQQGVGVKTTYCFLSQLIFPFWSGVTFFFLFWGDRHSCRYILYLSFIACIGDCTFSAFSLTRC